MRNTYIRKNGNAIVTSAASDTASIEGRQSRLIAAALAMLFTGVIYAWSVFKVPLASEFGWSVSASAVQTSVWQLSAVIGSTTPVSL